MREERHKLTQELKRTPELISKTLADLKEQRKYAYKSQQLIFFVYLLDLHVWQCLHPCLPFNVLFR